MDDLTGRLGEILNSPEGMNQLKNLAAMLGLSGMSSSSGGAGAAPEPSAESMPPAPAAPSMPSMPALDGDMMQAIMKFAPLLGGMQKEDDTTRFLMALRPLLGEERRKKLDEAVKILRLLRLLPLLQGSGGGSGGGLLSSLFNL